MAVGLREFALGEDTGVEQFEAFELLGEEEPFDAGFGTGAKGFFFPRKSRGASPCRRICS